MFTVSIETVPWSCETITLTLSFQTDPGPGLFSHPLHHCLAIVAMSFSSLAAR